MGGFGWTFFLFLTTSNEFISGEKHLLTFLSNLSRSLLRLMVYEKYSTGLEKYSTQLEKLIINTM